MEKYYTTTKSGETVEVSKELKEELIRLGKKESNDFTKKEIAKSAYTLKLKDAQGKESFQDVEIDDPYSNPENLRSIVADIKDAGFQVVNFEPKGASQQKEIDQTAESISPIFGRTGMEYLKEGSPIKAGITAGLTAPLRIAKTIPEVIGQSGANVINKIRGVESPANIKDVALSSLAGNPSDTWVGDKLTDIAEDPTMVPSSMVGGAAIKGMQGLGGLARGALGGLAETGTSLGIRKGLGDKISGEQAGKELALGGAFGAGGELLGSLFKKGLGKGGEYLKNTGADKSGASRNALEFASTKEGRNYLSMFSEKSPEVGAKIIDLIDNAERYSPKWKAIESSLGKMPDVDMTGVNEVIESSLHLPKGRTPITTDATKAANAAILAEFEYNLKDLPFENINDVVDVDIYNQLSQKKIGSDQLLLPNLGKSDVANNSMMQDPISLMDYRRQLDKGISKAAFHGIDATNPITNSIEKAKTKVRKFIRKKLIETAESSGNPEYVSNMEDLSNILKNKERAAATIGKTPITREANAADLSKRYDTGVEKKKISIEAIKNLDDLFGTDVAKQMQGVTYANMFNKGGTGNGLPKMASLYGTGKALDATMLKSLGLGSPKINAQIYYPLINKLNELAQSQGTTLTELFKSAQRNMFRQQSQAQGDTLGSMAQ